MSGNQPILIPSEYVTVVQNDNDTAPSAPPMAATTSHQPVEYKLRRDLGRLPTQAQCPVCDQLVVTRVSNDIIGVTWCAAITLLIVFWPLCFLPFVLVGCKETIHRCGQCENVLGKTEACA
uniref:LITAF domain-containing protein n=1 Tax=Corethron hystrix TaxID=216773 RepID=A0A7S1BWA1_9STRA|mmetsp:Transcript_41760/g.97781  ORF Transcript_41760/g.97781 Transcript_41760/m.97781 type:complete len:121 (+) Transcript_41760:107-469(+)